MEISEASSKRKASEENENSPAVKKSKLASPDASPSPLVFFIRVFVVFMTFSYIFILLI